MLLFTKLYLLFVAMMFAINCGRDLAAKDYAQFGIGLIFCIGALTAFWGLA